MARSSRTGRATASSSRSCARKQRPERMHGTHLEDLTTKIRPRTASNLLLWFVVAFIVAFFLWAGFTKLDRTVRGQGRVIPSARLQVISNLEGGVVQEIMVHAGQQVRAGDVLIRLDPTASGSELGSG